MTARRLVSITLAAGLSTFSAFVPAVSPASKREPARKADQKPNDATAQCADDTYSRAKTEQGACSAHGGVKTWFGGAAAPTPRPSPTAERSTSRAATPARRSGTTASTAPSDATARCKDGSYSSAQSRSGACAGHGGVATWLAATTAAAPAPQAPPPAPQPEPTAAPTPAPRAAPTPAPRSAPPVAPPVVPRPNTSSGSKAPTEALPPGAPADATAKCKDGTYSRSKTHEGACSYHQGVAEWFK